ncbi:DUF1275 family protein [Kitasatospora sp. NPDC048239]|uniref:DUF1275 family protein n=1 Tax=Kitasatospora sp. NPDC048239 TaxID=3364046 RepID=UPI0037110A6C
MVERRWSAGVRRAVAPDRHGPLVPMLLLLTLGTGMVDAVSFLALGHVFVANMTGNVIFLGFALAGTAGLSATSSLTALAAFLAGALAGGRFCECRPAHRGRTLVAAMAVQAGLVAVAVVLEGVAGHGATPVRHALIALLAFAVGLQNAVVRDLRVPDLTTTVLTMTLTALAADRAGVRRIASAVSMFTGALLGALLVLHVNVTSALVVALALVAAVAVITRRACADRPGAPDPAWTRPPGA